MQKELQEQFNKKFTHKVLFSKQIVLGSTVKPKDVISFIDQNFIGKEALRIIIKKIIMEGEGQSFFIGNEIRGQEKGFNKALRLLLEQLK